MLPLLEFSSDKDEHSLREAIEALAGTFNLSSDERRELLPSGLQSTFDNRVNWAKTYLTKAVLLESTRRGYFKIAQRGIEVLDSTPPKISVKFLNKFPEFLDFQSRKKRKKAKPAEQDDSPSASWRK